jgi:ABC-2 type transport system ATP-binding protein
MGRLDDGSVQVEESTRRVSVGVDPGRGDLTEALRAVQGSGIEIDDIALRQPNLDEVFLALTGQSTEDPDPPAAHAA